MMGQAFPDTASPAAVLAALAMEIVLTGGLVSTMLGTASVPGPQG